MDGDFGLVWVGKVIAMYSIPGADFIDSATVVCGKGGKWKGVVKIDEFEVGSKCLVYMPDTILPNFDCFEFMKSREYRVRMCRFRGAPSEVLIMPYHFIDMNEFQVGEDVTDLSCVKRYHKPVPANLIGNVKGLFPQFIPKTDELNYQRCPELVDALHLQHYYITMKMDGSSTTAYKYKGEFGVCSRNYELFPDVNNGYWNIARKYNLEEVLPEGIAIQWETCGPKIQKNPMGLKEIEGYVFSAYNIPKHKYLTMSELIELCDVLAFPMVPLLRLGMKFDKSDVATLGEGKYDNGNEMEGVVVRSTENVSDGKPISFKVINLNYET